MTAPLYEVKESAEEVRSRVAGATLTHGFVTITLEGYGEFIFGVRGTMYEPDRTLSLVEGKSFDDRYHITLHLHDTGQVTARLAEQQ